MFKFHENRPQKVFCFFRRHVAAVRRRTPKFSRPASDLSAHLRVRFRPDRFSFLGVISGKLVSTPDLDSDSDSDLLFITPRTMAIYVEAYYLGLDI